MTFVLIISLVAIAGGWALWFRHSLRKSRAIRNGQLPPEAREAVFMENAIRQAWEDHAKRTGSDLPMA